MAEKRRYTAREVCERGKALYELQIGPHVARGDAGKFLLLDIETGAYEIDADEVAAFDRARAWRQDATFYLVRIGAPDAHRIRGCARATVGAHC